MTVIKLVEELRRRGVWLEADGDHLKVEAPPDSLTEELRAELSERKLEVLAYLRTRFIIDRMTEAAINAERKYPGRFDWRGDTPEAAVALSALDDAMACYVEGTQTIEDIQAAWGRYVRALDTSTRASKTEQLSFI